MYEVIEYFEDLQDSNHPYCVGDIFPRSGLVVSKERFEELSSTNNRRGIKLIQRAKEKTKSEEFTKSSINKMSLAELRTLAGEVGIAGYDSLKNASLKKQLIEHFNL